MRVFNCIGVQIKMTSGDQEKFCFGLNWSHSRYFRFDFSLGENNFNEFDGQGNALWPLLQKFLMVANYFFELLRTITFLIFEMEQSDKK